jgi:hypothetical protein
MQIPKYVLCLDTGDENCFRFYTLKAAEEARSFFESGKIIEDAPEESEPKYIPKDGSGNHFPKCGNCMNCSECVTLC